MHHASNDTEASTSMEPLHQSQSNLGPSTISASVKDDRIKGLGPADGDERGTDTRPTALASEGETTLFWSVSNSYNETISDPGNLDSLAFISTNEDTDYNENVIDLTSD